MMKPEVKPEIIAQLSKTNFIRTFLLILMDWGTIFLVIYITNIFFNPFTYLLAIMLIATRQHGLLILMHDASHGRFCLNKRWNDAVGNMLTAWPLFIQMEAYRERHLAHHRFSNTPQDPDFLKSRFPITRSEIYKLLIFDFFALNTKAQFKEIKTLQIKTSLFYKIMRTVYYVTILAFLIYFKLMPFFFLYWIIPAFTWLKVCLRLRAISDHTGLQHLEGPYDTRTVIPQLFDRFFIAPHESSYHFSHHAFAAVPCYHLKRMHEEIMKTPSGAKVHVTKGYFGLLKEFPRTSQELSFCEEKFNVSFTKNMPI